MLKIVGYILLSLGTGLFSSMEFSEDVVIEGASAKEARIAFLNMDLIVEAHPLLRSWRLVSSEHRDGSTCSHIELVDQIMGFNVIYQAEMLFDPLDPTGNIQFDSEAALSIKVSHTYSFRDAVPGGTQPYSAPTPAAAAIISDRVSVRYGLFSFPLKMFVDGTVRDATRKVLDNMRSIIQQRIPGSRA